MYILHNCVCVAFSGWINGGFTLYFYIYSSLATGNEGSLYHVSSNGDLFTYTLRSLLSSLKMFVKIGDIGIDGLDGIFIDAQVSEVSQTGWRHHF